LCNLKAAEKYSESATQDFDEQKLKEKKILQKFIFLFLIKTDFFENFSVNSLKRVLSNDTTFNPPLISLFNTCKEDFKNIQIKTIWPK
jgi:hypothetical protein